MASAAGLWGERYRKQQRLLQLLALLLLLQPQPFAGATLPPETLLTVFIDDLGFADTQINNPLSPTPHIGQLARSGIELTQFYAYMYCSPSRRSVLSGRFPVHLGTEQAPVCAWIGIISDAGSRSF